MCDWEYKRTFFDVMFCLYALKPVECTISVFMGAFLEEYHVENTWFFVFSVYIIVLQKHHKRLQPYPPRTKRG